jgi:N-acyl-L-homoserine lactone synthetase
MIDCVDIATTHLFGDALASQYRLRHRVFRDRLAWDLPTWDGMEFDQFDTPATTYFTWRDQSGVTRGISRVIPTVRPYMLQCLWPEMVTAEPMPHDMTVWEGSRIGIDGALDANLRRRILGEIFCAYLEFGLKKGIERYLVLMPLAFLKYTVVPVGWPPRFIGPVKRFGTSKCIAASMAVSQSILNDVRGRMKVESHILRTADDLERDKAA